MFSKYTNNFPDGYTPFDNQTKLLTQIESAFDEGHKFVIVSAPTGTGKSFIPRTLGNVSSSPSNDFIDLVKNYKAFHKDYSGNYLHEDDCLAEPPFGTFTLTITKQLQDQYKTLFDEIDILKGKQNYLCDIDDSFDVETAPCVYTKGLKQQCWGSERCHYYTNRNNALINEFSVLNYKMFAALPDHVKRKEFLVCDEASELEDELVRQFSASISYKKLDQNGVEFKHLRTNDINIQYRWLSNLIINVNSALDELKNKSSNKVIKMSTADVNKLKYLQNLHRSLKTVENYWYNCEYIVDYNKEKVTYTPLKVDKLSNNIFKFGEKILLMSATIIDHKSYAKSLGIKKYKYIESKSLFDPNNSPIFLMKEPVLNYKNLQHYLPKLAKQCLTICKHHLNEKGIIHTHSLDICKFLQRYLTDKRFLFRETTATNEKILKDHFESPEPTVLVSPSLGFGTDLKDNHGRFQIMMKTPFLPLSDKRIKKLAEMDNVWYENKTLSAFIQTTGRCTRSTKDHSVTYVLDGKARNLLINNKHKLPKHFIDRLK